MRHHRSRTRTGHRNTFWWPVLLLSLVVLVPTACLLWFMNEAIENQRLAVRQELTDAYDSHLSLLRTRLNEFWKRRSNAFEKIVKTHDNGATVFAQCVREGLADSVICCDTSGEPVYPSSTPYRSTVEPRLSSSWAAANRLEYVDADWSEAAKAYAQIAETTSSADEAARAVLAQARCLERDGRTDEALRSLTGTLNEEKYRRAVDLQGRTIVVDAELRAVQIMSRVDHANLLTIAQRLAGRLNDYSESFLPAAQRRFGMRQLLEVLPEEFAFPTLAAEDLAAQAIEVSPASVGPVVVRVPNLNGVWQFSPSQGRICALFQTKTINNLMREAIESAGLFPDVNVRLVSPDDKGGGESVFASIPAGEYLPGWRLDLSPQNTKLLDDTAGKKTAAYVWTGMLVIASMSILAAFVAEMFRRQMKLTRLRNDLVATVSHELKTPVASIRLLVDTLLDASEFDEKTVREYLELMAGENRRLGRLIDNFLTFSRMERNKHAFVFERVEPAAVVQTTVVSFTDRVATSECRFSVEVADDLPPIDVDSDAIVTAVLNLLDNAYKYSGDDREIALRVRSDDGHVLIAVQDNGIGLAKADIRKVFRRFYQVDQRLSRRSGGCGLGLSIVQFIVAAHGGSVRVDSCPGQGSTFTIGLPTARSLTPT